MANLHCQVLWQDAAIPYVYLFSPNGRKFHVRKFIMISALGVEQGVIYPT